jgi:DNA polymerase elongation subunit (family B)
VLRLTPPGRGCPDGARPFPTEKHLLAAFCARVRELDPDVLTGWNVVDFDLTVLDRIAGPNGVPLELGRGPGTLHLRAQGSPRGARQATIPGRVVLDGIHLLRVASSIAAFDLLYLAALGRRGIVAPSVRAEAEIVEPQAEGHVLEPLPGLYTNAVALDFESLYPSIIRTFEVDPRTSSGPRPAR